MLLIMFLKQRLPKYYLSRENFNEDSIKLHHENTFNEI